MPVFTGTSLRFLHRGIPATEVMAVMESLLVPAKRRARVLRGVRVMAAAAAPLLNTK